MRRLASGSPRQAGVGLYEQLKAVQQKTFPRANSAQRAGFAKEGSVDMKLANTRAWEVTLVEYYRFRKLSTQIYHIFVLREKMCGRPDLDFSIG